MPKCNKCGNNYTQPPCPNCTTSESKNKLTASKIVELKVTLDDLVKIYGQKIPIMEIAKAMNADFDLVHSQIREAILTNEILGQVDCKDTATRKDDFIIIYDTITKKEGNIGINIQIDERSEYVPFFCQIDSESHPSTENRYQCIACGRLVCEVCYDSQMSVGMIVCPFCNGKLVYQQIRSKNPIKMIKGTSETPISTFEHKMIDAFNNDIKDNCTEISFKDFKEIDDPHKYIKKVRGVEIGYTIENDQLIAIVIKGYFRGVDDFNNPKHIYRNSYNSTALTIINDLIDNISSLENLQMIGICFHDPIPKLNDLKQLSKLEYLILDGCNLYSISEEISGLRNLKYLSFVRNYLERIPYDIINLQLTELDLQFNNITQLPDWLWEGVSLKKINLSGNRLKIYPYGLKDLPSLKEVDLSYAFDSHNYLSIWNGRTMIYPNDHDGKWQETLKQLRSKGVIVRER